MFLNIFKPSVYSRKDLCGAQYDGANVWRGMSEKKINTSYEDKSGESKQKLFW
jgi:hypothetical protein